MCAQAAIADVDPELLQARINAVKSPTTRDWAHSLSEAALAAMVGVRAVDVASLQNGVADQTAHEMWASADEPVAAMWLGLEELRQLMSPLVRAYQAQQGDEAIAGDFDSASEEGDESRADLELDDILRRIAETAWAMTFVLAGEVEWFRRRLAQVLQLEDAWELAEALEDHVGHVRSAVGALLTGIYASLPRAGPGAEADESVEALTARELRARVFELRDAIVDIEDRMRRSPAGTWQPLLVEARQRVEGFIFGPGFAWMRATDKRTFLVQRRALTELLAMYSPLRADPARRTVANLARFLEAMEVINQRESLMLHDRSAIAAVIEHMALAKAGGPGARDHIAAALAALSEAQGRDHLLDALLAQTMAPGSDVPVDSILERARAVLARLGG
jgi:hypothetical protein